MALFSGVNQQRRSQPTTAPIGGPQPTGGLGAPQRPAFNPNKQGPQLPGGQAGLQLQPGQQGFAAQQPGADLRGFDPNGVAGPRPEGLFGTTSSAGPPPPNSLGMDTAPVGAPPLAGTPPTQQFGPGNNLISTQFNPTASEGLQGVQQDIFSDLEGLRTGPSRGELASQAFSQIQEASAPRFQSELRDVGRRAATLGRIGSGVTTSELGDVQVTRERDLDLLRRGLATDAAGRGLEDRFRQLGATQGVSGQLFGQEQSGRNELRGERGFQEGLDRRAVQERVQQRALEEALLEGQFGRDFSRQGLFADIGFGGGSQANFGNQAGRFAQNFGNQANASNQSAAGLFGSLFNQGGGQQQQFPQPTGRTGLGDFTERRGPDFNPRR